MGRKWLVLLPFHFAKLKAMTSYLVMFCATDKTGEVLVLNVFCSTSVQYTQNVNRGPLSRYYGVKNGLSKSRHQLAIVNNRRKGKSVTRTAMFYFYLPKL